LTIRRLVNHSQQVDTFNKLKLLISTGAQADCVSKSNESAFSCASIQYASADIIKLLLDNGANPRVASSSKLLQSPLILLAHTTNSVEAIKALIQSYDKEFVRAIQEHSLPVVDYAQRNTHLSEEDRNAVIALLQEYLL
jgi:ankyrin repeat protein